MRSFLPRLGQPVWVLLSGVLFTHLGTYMLLPYFSIILNIQKGLSLTHVGLVLAAGSIAYLVGSLLGGMLADRLGGKRTMVCGLLLRGFGLLLFIWAGTFPALLGANLLAGLGGGLYMPAAKAGIANMVAAGTKTTAFSYRGIAAQIGLTMGPPIGGFLLTGSMNFLFAGAAFVYAALAAGHVFLLTRDCVGENCPETARGAFKEVFRDRPFLLFSLATVFVWALFTQYTLSLPLRGVQIGVAQNIIGWVFTATAVFNILLQLPLTRWFTNNLHPLQAIALGLAVVGVGLGTVAFSTTLWQLVGSALLFTFGQMFIMPTSDAIVSDLARPEQVGNYFGISAFMFGMGEALGNMGGGRLMEAAVGQNFLALPWILYASLGLVLAGVYYAFTFWKALAGPLTPVLKERTKHPAK